MPRGHKVEIAALLAILLTGAMVRGLVFSRLEHSACPPRSDPCKIYASHDQPQYHALAVSLVENGSFAPPGEHGWIPRLTGRQLSAKRTPGYPLFIAGFYRVFGYTPWPVVAGQLALDLLVVILVYLLAFEVVANRGGALVAAAFYALSFESVFWATRLLSETLFTILMVTSLLLVIRGQRMKSPALVTLAGVALGLGALVRPIALYLPFLFVFYIWISCWRDRLKRRGVYAAAVLIAFGVTVMPWFVRNYHVLGHFALTNVFSSNLCWSASRLRHRIENRPFNIGIRECMTPSWVGRADPFEVADEAGRRALSYIAQHPLEYAKLHLWGISRALRHLPARHGGHWRAIDIDAARVRSVGAVTLSRVGLLLGFAGLILLCARREGRITGLFLLCCISYFLAVVGPLGNARFRAPLIPVYLIGVAWSVPTIGLICRRIWRRLAFRFADKDVNRGLTRFAAPSWDRLWKPASPGNQVGEPP